MNSTPFLIDCLVNSSFFVQSPIDTGCLCYAPFSNELVNNNKLSRIPIAKRILHLAKLYGKQTIICEMRFAILDIDGRKEKVYGYVIND